MDEILTQRVIKILQDTPQCLQSIKQVPCDDYKARFGAWLRVKHGVMLPNNVDWTEVAKQVNPAL